MDDDLTLLERWSLLLPQRPDLGTDLVARYADPARRYHDRRHLSDVLDRVAELAAELDDSRAVMLAAWFHDAVYDVRAGDNEERSAQLAEHALAAAGEGTAMVLEVARLVRVTASHQVAPDDRNGAVLCDADLAVLAGDEQSYARYSSAVREEYAHVDTESFRRGRAAVLENLLALPVLFSTSYGRAHWEAPARYNLNAELASLR
ncbi:MAG TPA: metal-dependent phosphohydrolase [Nocardioidaceae bacterium]|nr:metal-dependent phosphohydrolase [Nocardioidaceae bacterium]